MILSSLTLLLLSVSGVLANPVPELHIESRAAPTNLVKINSASDYCMIVPKNARTNIGDSERPGGTTTYCSRSATGGQGTFPSNFWRKVSYKKGKGKTGQAYVQLTGCINSSSLDRLNPGDGGGQYDSSGGSGGRGNPVGSQCLGYKHYVELIEPDVSRACIRCCNDYNDCPLSRDTAGCPSVIPGSYPGCG